MVGKPGLRRECRGDANQLMRVVNIQLLHFNEAVAVFEEAIFMNRQNKKHSIAFPCLHLIR